MLTLPLRIGARLLAVGAGCIIGSIRGLEPTYERLHVFTHDVLHPLMFGCHPERCEIRHTLEQKG